MPNHSSIRTVLGFDFGMRKIGIAIGQLVTKTANPLTVLSAVDGVPKWDQIHDLIDLWNVDALVVGIPLNMDGTEQPITQSAKRFANKLRHRFQLPVFEVDERLTTVEAKREMKKENLSKKNRRMDSYAAKIILESWLHEHSS